MRDKLWETALLQHQHDMIQRLDRFRKRKVKDTPSLDEKMVIEHSFQLLIASMLDLAKYVLAVHYRVEVNTRHDVLAALKNNKDVTYEQSAQIETLIQLREKILHDYLDENFALLNQAMDLRRYSLVEVLAKEWIARLDSTENDSI